MVLLLHFAKMEELFFIKLKHIYAIEKTQTNARYVQTILLIIHAREV